MMKVLSLFFIALTICCGAKALRLELSDIEPQENDLDAENVTLSLGKFDGHELSDTHDEHLPAWNEFKAMFSRTYESFEEELYRFKTFVDNLLFVNSHNKLYREGKVTFSVRINEFADMTSKEFAVSRNGLRMNARQMIRKFSRPLFYRPAVVTDLPANVDWREKGYVTPIKSQGNCGSCWSFSTTGALEGQWFAKTGNLVSLSEQQLVDCSKAWGDNGCNGGLMDNAFTYVKAIGGLESESTYPYTAKEGPCKFNKSAVVAQDTGFVDVPQGDEAALQQSLATVGPISVAIDASQTSFQLYHEGIYSDPNCSPSSLDHGILAVGYGSDDQGNDFWIIKNSWGTNWGEQGFGRMARNKENMCGIASAASYPTV